MGTHRRARDYGVEAELAVRVLRRGCFMRLLITAEVLRHVTTGVERYTAELARAVSNIRDIDLALFAERPEHLSRFQFPFRAITRRSLPTPFRTLSYALLPGRLFQGFDVIHCPIMVAPFVLTPVLRRPGPAKIVMTCHDLIPLILPEYQRRSLNLYFKWWLPRVLPLVDAFIANSQWTKRDMVKWLGIPTEKIFVVYLAADSSAMTPLELQEPENYFLAVGTLEPRKNLERVIRAFMHVVQEHPQAPDKLVLVGRRGQETGRLRRLMKDAGDRVQATGYLSDERLAELYRHAKALVYPSLYEGFGLPVLEAMGRGCPVITSNTTSLPEVAGNAAICVDPTDIDDIARAMSRVLTQSDLRQELARNGIARAAEFSWDRCARETVQVYEHVLNHA